MINESLFYSHQSFFIKVITMSEVLKTLLNIRSLRATTRELSITELEEAFDKFGKIVEERRVEQEQAEAEVQAKFDKISKYKDMLAEDGLSAEDLMAMMESRDSAPRKKREPRPAKYEYFVDGERKTWTGQGRTPAYIAQQEAQGIHRDEFLIR